MHPLLLYVFKSLFVSGLLMCYYWFFLRNRKMHTFNRFYLLISVVVSFIVPLLHFDLYSIAPHHQVAAYKLLQAIGPDEHDPIINHARTGRLPTATLIGYGYLLSVLIFLTGIVARLKWLANLRHSGKTERMDGYKVVRTDIDGGPFSYFNTLYCPGYTDLSSDAGRQILAHELVHIRQRHTLDKLFLQLSLSVVWFNPFLWLANKELSLVHEFLADEAVDGDAGSFAHLLLHTVLGPRLPLLVNPFFHSPIKRRLFMLTNHESIRFAHLRRLAIAPMLGSVIFLQSFTINKANSNPAVERAKRTVVMVLDAGHGGQDNGAVSTSGRKEKDIALSMTTLMAGLAPEYNIQVVLIRKDDNYVVLEKRTEIANNIAADLFVSLHVNTANKADNTSAGYGLCVSPKNVKYAESKALASVVGARLDAVNAHPYLFEKGVHVLKENRHTALLVECSDMENDQLTNSKYKEKMCRTILSGIVEYENGL